MEALKETVFIAALVAGTFLVGSLVVTLLMPGLRIWPPPRRTSWQYVFTWGLTGVLFASIVALGILDWNSLGLSHWLRFAVGVPIIAASTGLVLWAVHTLGVHASQGLGGTFVRQGPYRFTRNPQYVADIAMLSGFALLSGSMLVIPVCLLGIAWFALAPFTEEPWLRTRHGPEYDEYIKLVPRFL